MKKANKKANAAIIVIGNEILSGRTQDVNVVHLSKWLNELGVKVEEVRVIPDLEDSIANTISDVRKNFKYIFTTGGIGPTHDDVTSRSICKAFNIVGKSFSKCTSTTAPVICVIIPVLFFVILNCLCS